MGIDVDVDVDVDMDNQDYELESEGVWKCEPKSHRTTKKVEQLKQKARVMQGNPLKRIIYQNPNLMKAGQILTGKKTNFSMRRLNKKIWKYVKFCSYIGHKF